MKTVNKEIVNSLIKKIRHDSQKNLRLDIDLEDVLFSYFNSTNEVFHILVDWNELIEEEKIQIDYIEECLEFINEIVKTYE